MYFLTSLIPDLCGIDEEEYIHTSVEQTFLFSRDLPQTTP